MKILKLKIFQESACYKKPFAFKVAETYPLPPYSTVIGMFHKILNAKSGEYFPMNISIQGEYESIFNNYQNLRMYKKDGTVTAMPRNIHQLLNVTLIIHVKAEDNIIDKIYENIINGTEVFTLGRNEDLARIDDVKIITEIKETKEMFFKHNMYVPINYCDNIEGINYRLNSTYTIDKNNLRKWKKVDVKYVEPSAENNTIENITIDEEKDLMVFNN